MTDDITELRAALAAATPGPWVTGNTDPLLFGRKQGNGTEPLGFVYGPSRAEESAHGRECLATAAYIAACNPDRIARLLDRLEAAEAVARSMSAPNDEFVKWPQVVAYPGGAAPEGYCAWVDVDIGDGTPEPVRFVRAAIDAAMHTEGEK
jgi:hypothetical protein